MRLNCGNRWSIHSIKSKVKILKSNRDSNTPHRILVSAFGSDVIERFDRGVVRGPGKKDSVPVSDGRGHVEAGRRNKGFLDVELRKERSGHCAVWHISDLAAFASAEG